MNLPNKLTVFRMALVIPLITIFSLFMWYVIAIEKIDFKNVGTKSNAQYFLYGAGAIFVISMITDFFDGMLARKKNQITTFGKLFDPLSDKVIVTTSLIFIAIFNYTYLILVILSIIRDLMVDGSRNLMASRNMKIEASIYGKLKTLFQTIAIIVLLFLSPTINQSIWWEKFLLNIPMILATLTSLISGWLYLKQILPIVRKDM